MNRKLKNTNRLWIGLKKVEVDITTARLYFFYGKTFDDHIHLPLEKAKEILKNPHFDNRKPTVLYLHGYIETMESESIHVIVDAYIKRNDHNILVLDWADLAEGNYMIDAVPNAKYFADHLSDIIIGMFLEGLENTKFHLVGHSLGGQLSGMVGRTIYAKTDKAVKLKRISALDPAFIGFYPPIYKPLSATDAEFVDVIHTDAWLYGAPFSTGTVDFWPNSGKTLQPGCPKRNYKLLTDNDLSSHRRSWFFWADSLITKEPSFHSIKCPNWKKFQTINITDSKDQIAYMGIDCQTNVSGDYYLQTNGESPFSKGEAGIKYQEV